jgi:hypothetical protein
MKKKLNSTIAARGLIFGFAIVGTSSAHAEPKPIQVAVYGSEWVCTIVYG